MPVGEDLNFNMTRFIEVFFHVYLIVTEGCFGFLTGHIESIGSLIKAFDNLHPTTTAARCRLD